MQDGASSKDSRKIGRGKSSRSPQVLEVDARLRKLEVEIKVLRVRLSAHLGIGGGSV